MQKLWRFFNKDKDNKNKERIQINISEHSKEFFLEDATEY